MGEIGFNQLELAVRLMEVVHNVDYKGDIKIEMAPYDTDLK
jgi:hypothetical protein